MVLLYLQVTFNFIGGAVSVVQWLQDGCDTSLCCEECASIDVTRVIDGDTFVSSGGMRVRLFGVDTPEQGERCYAKATDRLRELASNEARVEDGPRFFDRYSRRLYYVYTESGESIDEKLIREGLGRAWTQDGQHVSTLLRLELGAKLGNEGCLW